MRIDEIKTELFSFLADQAILYSVTKWKGKTALFRIQMNNRTLLCPCTHEEGDARLLHTLDASAEGYKIVMIWTVDVDIVVLVISFVSELGTCRFWIDFAIGKILGCISARDSAENLGIESA